MAKAKGMGFEIDLVECAPSAVKRPQRTMRMLVLGDFSGRVADADLADDPRIAARPIVAVDVDSFDDVLWRFAPHIKLPLPGAGESVELEFRTLEDFHPDALYRRLPVFAQLRELRGRLLDPTSFAAAAGELQGLLGESVADLEQQKVEVDERSTPAESDSEAIERLLGKPVSADTGARSAPAEKGVAAVSELIRRIVGPETAAEQPPRQQVYLQALDEMVGRWMCALLHAPAFQALEALWRSVHGLVSGLETDEGLQVHLLDVTKEELAADLIATRGELRSSGLYRLLVEAGVNTPGGEPWSLVVGSFDFGPETADIALLAALGAVASHAGGPFIAAASPALLGCRSLAETPDPSDWEALPDEQESAWSAVRRSSVAPWLGLALPRLLLRLPYGQETEPVEAFAFEELAVGRRHKHYLWGNPAFACALLIGRAYEGHGWSMAPGDVLDLDELPAHVYREEGEARLQACAEAYLSERAAGAILDQGLMPLLSFKGRNMVRLARFQSIAEPAAALAGPWGGG